MKSLLTRSGRLAVTLLVVALCLDLAFVPMTLNAPLTLLVIGGSIVAAALVAAFWDWLNRVFRRFRRWGWA